MGDANETTVTEGRFWLPDDRYRGYGRLEYSPEFGLRIHLVDTNLTGWTDEGLERPEAIDVLHGETLGGTPLTLLDVMPRNWSFQGVPPTGGDTLDAWVRRVVRGAWVDSDEEIQARRVGASLSGLREFLTGGTVDGGVLAVPHEDPAFDSLVVDVGNGVQLTLMASRQRSMSRTSETTRLTASVGWTFDEAVDLPSAERDYVRALQDLVLFATRRPSAVERLSVDPEPDTIHSLEILQRPFPSAPDHDIYALALNLRELEDPTALIVRWHELRSDVGPVWDQFMSVLNRPQDVLESQLLGLLAYAEGYHRALHDQPPLTKKQAKAAKAAIKKALEDDEVRRVYSTALSHANSQTQRERLEALTDRALEVLGEWCISTATTSASN
jgi:hypothetical protein